jgi:hypothetical protein
VESTPAVIGIDPTTGAQKFRVPVSGTTPYGIIIAGDGYAYLPYVDQEPVGLDANDNPIWVSHFMVLQVDSSGNSNAIKVQDWPSMVEWEGGHMLFNMITNADQGILLTWQENTQAAVAGMATITTAGSVTLTAAPHVPGQLISAAVLPVLQAQDGSFVGTVQVGDPDNPQTDMIAFDGSANFRWTVPNERPQIATDDGGVIGQSGTTYDSNGNATGQIGNPQTYSWKGAYTDGPVNSVSAQSSRIAPTYGAAKGGNFTANGTHTRTTRFGLAWCGTATPNGISSCGPLPPNIPAPADVSFLYSNLCHATLPDVNFTSAQPQWVTTIQRTAFNTLMGAYRNYAIIVEWGSKDVQKFWETCQADPKCSGTDTFDQSHVVRVAGDPVPPGNIGYGITAGLQNTPAAGTWVGASNVYYYPIMQAAVGAWWSFTNNSNWCPSYPPLPGSPDLQKFQLLAITIGTGIGNAAAHELGHQLALFPYMDCGPPGVSHNGGTCQPDPKTGVIDNFVYNFYTANPQPSDPNNPNDPGNGGRFFYGLDVLPIHWQQQNMCYLQNFDKSEPSPNNDSWWSQFWQAITTGANPCAGGH